MKPLDFSKRMIWATLQQHGVVLQPKCRSDEGPWLTCDAETESIVISGHDKLADCERALMEAQVPYVRHEGYIEINTKELASC